MPRVIPFKGVRYNHKTVKRMADVVAPPYDIIPPKLHDELYAAHPNNFVKLELNKITPADTAAYNRYTRAEKLLNEWLKKKILVRDDKEAFYIYSQDYIDRGKKKTRVGFLGLMELDMTGRKVLAHENTLAAPKTDRLNLIRRVRANLSPIFVLYDDKSHAVARALKAFGIRNKPVIDLGFEGIRNRVWKCEDKAVINKISRIMSGKDIFIADGHHRYEVSRMYARELAGKNAPIALRKAAKYLMVYFVESDKNMLTVLPAHRVVKDTGAVTVAGIIRRLEKHFKAEKAVSLDGMMSKLEKYGSHTFGVYSAEDGFHVIRLKSASDPDKAIKDRPAAWRRLDVSILHLFILQHLLGISDDDDNIDFLKDPRDAVKAVDSGDFRIAFFLNPTGVDEVKAIARLGERMPRKATYFYPKQLSGLVINKF